VIKLLFDVSNFYNQFKTSIIIKLPKIAEGGTPHPPLKRLQLNFCQPRDAPLPHLAEKVKGGISENDGHLRCVAIIFGTLVNMVGTLCAERARRQFANF